MNTLIDILRVTGLVAFVGFGIVYHLGTAGGWRRTKAGPWIMALTMTPVLLLLNGLAVVRFGADATWVQGLRVLTMCVLNAMPVWLCVLFVRAQRASRKDHHHEDLRS